MAGQDAKAPDALSTAASNKSNPFYAQNKVSRLIGVPKGVYRFKTHEEADEWINRMLARNIKATSQSEGIAERKEVPPKV